MISFFRKIRWRLASENEFYKYFRYAIGEILLVVVGILIALYINNWNEEQKTAQREVSYLKNLQTDLQTDQKMIEQVITEQQAYYERSLKLIALVRNYKPENLSKFDSIYAYQAGGNPTFFPVAGTYRSLVLGGNLDMISQNSLKSSLTNLYEYAYQRLQYNGEIFDQKILSFNQPRKTFIHLGFTEKALLDPTLLNGLLDDMEWRQSYINRCEMTKQELLKVLEHVQAEIRTQS